MKLRFPPDSRRRRLLIAAAIFVVTTGVFFACAAPSRIFRHTPFNHYALLAESWLAGRLDLGGAPPPYSGNNDFALHGGRWYVSFPPFPAVLLLPLLAIAGEAEKVRDGQLFLWLAGLGPAFTFLVLEKLRRAGYSARSERIDVALALLLAFGTVYFFTAEQGTVWFAAQVVGVILVALYLLFAIGAERPVLAGLMIALAFATRGPTIALGGLFFVFEAFRQSRAAEAPRALDRGALARRLGWFALPIVPVLATVLWHNHARFGDPFEFGHGLLTVAWKGRIDTWGLFSYHYLARNLGVMLTSLPYVLRQAPYVQINEHGLALWVTTPVFLWLFWPRRSDGLWKPLAITAALVAFADLLYQNSGWQQFGYRFSNDYAVYLIALLAVGGFRLGRLFWTCALVGVAVNTFGALTFQRANQFYFHDPSQRTLYQPD